MSVNQSSNLKMAGLLGRGYLASRNWDSFHTKVFCPLRRKHYTSHTPMAQARMMERMGLFTNTIFRPESGLISAPLLWLQRIMVMVD